MLSVLCSFSFAGSFLVGPQYTRDSCQEWQNLPIVSVSVI